MAKEIERKFLVDLKKLACSGAKRIARHKITQGYLYDRPVTVRIRISDQLGFLTVKTKAVRLTRGEYEYRIPIRDAKSLIKQCNKVVEKIRIVTKYGGKLWEVDVFTGDNKGLVVAEIELKSENEKFVIPPFCKKEVTFDKKYLNSNLVKRPFKTWKRGR